MVGMARWHEARGDAASHGANRPPQDFHRRRELTQRPLRSSLFPTVVVGIFVAAVLAAIMSTIDSLLVVASSAVTRDIYQQTLHPERAGDTLTGLSRRVTLTLAVVAAAIAMSVAILVPGRTIFWFVIFGWSGIAATFCPMIVLSLCWRRYNAHGAMASMVAGLVAITPASGFVGVLGALAIGVGAGGFCYGALLLRKKTNIDDALDVFAVHGIGGIWGALATGVFAVAAIGGTSGLIEGNASQMGTQILAVASTLAYSFVVSLIILKVLDLIPGLGLRSSESDEGQGLDLSSHGERATVNDGAD